MSGNDCQRIKTHAKLSIKNPYVPIQCIIYNGWHPSALTFPIVKLKFKLQILGRSNNSCRFSWPRKYQTTNLAF